MRHKERFLFPLLWLATSIATPVIAQEKSSLRLGGAVRFNYNFSNWKPDNRKRGGDFGFDVFRLNVSSAFRRFTLDAEYRFYPSASGGGMLKHGWIGYTFDDRQAVEVGLTQVPFGIQPYTANNYFFNLNYYVGLEDDADMGIKYRYRHGRWEATLAYFKNADITDFGSNRPTSPDRYAYDLGGRNKETHQGNLQVIYRFGNSVRQEVGISALAGGVYNLDTRHTGLRTAFALHYIADYRTWNLKAQYTTYDIRAKEPETTSPATVEMAAFGAPYRVASRADIYTAALSYTLPVGKAFLDRISFYNDFSLLHKRTKGFRDSYQNVTGCSLSAGPILAYIDYAVGKNHAWLGPEWDNAFAAGPDNGWHARFNINVGYYF